MRLTNLIKGDIYFQFKYGFYLLFLVFTFIYIVIIQVLPSSVSGVLSAVLIFTDPTAMGLIFMGAIVHFEISERTFNSLCISPVSTFEYLLSKLLSIGLLSTLSGVSIGLMTGQITNYFTFITGIFIGSLVFSTLGMIIALKTNSMNRFILLIIPIMIIVILPGVAYILALKSMWLIFHPGIAISELIINGEYSIMAIISLLAWLFVVVKVANYILTKRFKNESSVYL